MHISRILYGALYARIVWTHFALPVDLVLLNFSSVAETASITLAMRVLVTLPHEVVLRAVQVTVHVVFFAASTDVYPAAATVPATANYDVITSPAFALSLEVTFTIRRNFMHPVIVKASHKRKSLFLSVHLRRQLEQQMILFLQLLLQRASLLCIVLCNISLCLQLSFKLGYFAVFLFQVELKFLHLSQKCLSNFTELKNAVMIFSLCFAQHH